MHSVAKITRKMIAIGNPIGRKCKMIYIGIKITNRMTDFESDHFQKYAETSQLWVQISFQSMASNGFPLHVDSSTLKFDGWRCCNTARLTEFNTIVDVSTDSDTAHGPFGRDIGQQTYERAW